MPCRTSCRFSVHPIFLDLLDLGFIDDMMLKMAYALVMNLEVLNHLNFSHSFFGGFLNTREFWNLDFNARVILNMYFTFLVVVAGIGGGLRIERGEIKWRRGDNSSFTHGLYQLWCIQSARQLKFWPLFFGQVLYTCIQILDFDTRIELIMFFTFAIVVEK